MSQRWIRRLTGAGWPTVALFAALAVLLASMLAGGPALARETLATRTAAKTAAIAFDALPREARDTLTLIDKGGPFPYDKDGTVFGNFERRLPVQPRGYYREYTVKTPGERSRGARRIVTGKSGERYYTDDHYNSFQLIQMVHDTAKRSTK